MQRSVGGQELNFLVDTGAANVVLDSAAAKRLRMTVAPGGHVNNWFGTRTPYSYSGLPDLTLGKYTIPSMNVVVSDLSKMFGLRELEKDGKIDGILGTRVLMRHSAVIDYRSRTLFLRDAQKAQQELPRVPGKAALRVSGRWFPRDLPPVRLLLRLFPNVAGPYTAGNCNYTVNRDLSLTAEPHGSKARLTFRLDRSIIIGDGSGIDITPSPTTGK